MADEDQNQEKIHPAQLFIDEFEELVKKHKIEKYVAVFNIGDDNKPVVVYKPNNLNEITRVLKITHSQFLNKVMAEIGELNQ